MKILHYSLGFPPYRSGGLTKFCMDLMSMQVKTGHSVSLLWPGEIRIKKNTKICKRRSVNGIGSYEVINPVYVSYDEGIKQTGLFMAEGDYDCYRKFLERFHPDVIHIHTLMGLHKNLLVAAKQIGIRIVFTAHDFFPICSKVTLFRDGQICNSVEDCRKCFLCNATALPIWKLHILHHPIYRIMKNSIIVKKIRKRHRDAYLSGNNEYAINNVLIGDETHQDDYIALRNHYKSMLLLVSKIHYNSRLTRSIYEKYFGIFDAVTIPISHLDIKDCRKRKKFAGDVLRLTYLGPSGEGKGFSLLKMALDKLAEERDDFCLNIFFEMDNKPSYVIEHDRYTYSQLEDIFDSTDVLLSLSVWYETFGYTVVEALSYGVPVIVTKNVGARDVIPDGAGIIVDDISVEGIKHAVESITEARLCEMNRVILDARPMMGMHEMEHRIYEELYKEKL